MNGKPGKGQCCLEQSHQINCAATIAAEKILHKIHIQSLYIVYTFMYMYDCTLLCEGADHFLGTQPKLVDVALSCQ